MAAALVIAKEAKADVLGFEKIDNLQDGDRVYIAAKGLRDQFEL